jgi:hypothetical protein
MTVTSLKCHHCKKSVSDKNMVRDRLNDKRGTRVVYHKKCAQIVETLKGRPEHNTFDPARYFTLDWPLHTKY